MVHQAVVSSKSFSKIGKSKFPGIIKCFVFSLAQPVVNADSNDRGEIGTITINAENDRIKGTDNQKSDGQCLTDKPAVSPATSQQDQNDSSGTTSTGTESNTNDEEDEGFFEMDNWADLLKQLGRTSQPARRRRLMPHDATWLSQLESAGRHVEAQLKRCKALNIDIEGEFQAAETHARELLEKEQKFASLIANFVTEGDNNADPETMMKISRLRKDIGETYDRLVTNRYGEQLDSDASLEEKVNFLLRNAARGEYWAQYEAFMGKTVQLTSALAEVEYSDRKRVLELLQLTNVPEFAHLLVPDAEDTNAQDAE